MVDTVAIPIFAKPDFINVEIIHDRIISLDKIERARGIRKDIFIARHKDVYNQTLIGNVLYLGLRGNEVAGSII